MKYKYSRGNINSGLILVYNQLNKLINENIVKEDKPDPKEGKIREILGNFYDDAVENQMKCEIDPLYNHVATFVPKFEKAIKDLLEL